MHEKTLEIKQGDASKAYVGTYSITLSLEDEHKSQSEYVIITLTIFPVETEDDTD